MVFTFKHGDRPLEGYEIQRGVGQGGFGEVYYAVSDGGREVALKYLRNNPEVELRGIAQCINLKSPHLVSIFDVKQNKDGEYFVIMEYISGPSLRDMLIAEPKGLGTAKAAFFTREIAKGLSYLHDRGIVHRDLKPGNIFYDDGYVKIGDYGLTKFIAVSRHSAQTASVGTVHYMAPEVGSGNYSKPIDIYALGVILYEMLLGRVPYEGSSMAEVLMKHLMQQPEVSGRPAPFPDVIRKALAKDPKDRFQEADEMVRAIFEVEDVQKSMMGFEPASLTLAAGHAAQDIRLSPVPTPMRVGPAVPFATPVPSRSSDFSRRFVERTAGVSETEPRGEAAGGSSRKKSKQPTFPEKIYSPYPIGWVSRLGRLFAACVILIGSAVAMGIWREDVELGVVSGLTIALACVGLGISNRLMRVLGPDHPALVRGMVTLACTSPVAMLLYLFKTAGGHLLRSAAPNICFVLFVPFLLVNWRERIRKGARGQIGFWDAFWPALWAFVAGVVIVNGDADSAFWLALVAGMVSIVLQAFAWALVPNPLSSQEESELQITKDELRVRKGELGIQARRLTPVGEDQHTNVRADIVSGSAQSLGESRCIPGALWVALIALLVISCIEFAIVLILKTPFVFTVILNLILWLGLYRGRRWAYVLTIVLVSLAFVVEFPINPPMALVTLLLNSLVLVPVLMCRDYFWNKAAGSRQPVAGSEPKIEENSIAVSTPVELPQESREQNGDSSHQAPSGFIRSRHPSDEDSAWVQAQVTQALKDERRYRRRRAWSIGLVLLAIFVVWMGVASFPWSRVHLPSRWHIPTVRVGPDSVNVGDTIEVTPQRVRVGDWVNIETARKDKSEEGAKAGDESKSAVKKSSRRKSEPPVDAPPPTAPNGTRKPDAPRLEPAEPKGEESPKEESSPHADAASGPHSVSPDCTAKDRNHFWFSFADTGGTLHLVVDRSSLVIHLILRPFSRNR